MKKTTKIIIFACIVCLSTPLFYNNSYALSNTFNQSLVADFAKGHATTADLNGLEASYRNPTGLLSINHKKISIMSSSYFGNLYKSYEIAMGWRIKPNTVIAINLPARYIDNINYQENETLHSKVFSDKKQQVQLSVAKELQSKPIALGLSLGYQNQEIHTHKAQAVFISTGMIWKQGPLQFGAAIQQLGGMTLHWDYGKKEKTKASYLLGAKWQVNPQFEALIDLEKQNKEHLINLGSSYIPHPLLKILLGIHQVGKLAQSLRMGLNVNFQQLELNYAFSKHKPLGYIHKVKFAYDF